MINLDFIAAKYGQPLAFEDNFEESVINAALNILHAQGIYALFLWLNEAKKAERQKIAARIQALFQDPANPIAIPTDQGIAGEGAEGASTRLNNVRDIFTQDFAVMFFAKDLISLMLVYARHGAKTRAKAPQTPVDATVEADT